jgi:hypothetical protein
LTIAFAAPVSSSDSTFNRADQRQGSWRNAPGEKQIFGKGSELLTDTREATRAVEILCFLCDIQPGNESIAVLQFSRDGETLDAFGLVNNLLVGTLSPEDWVQKRLHPGIAEETLGVVKAQTIPAAPSA